MFVLGVRWCSLQQGGCDQGWLLSYAMLLLGLEEPIFLMWPGTPRAEGASASHSTSFEGARWECAQLCGCPESWFTRGRAG